MAKSMSKSDIAKHIAAKFSLTKRESSRILEALATLAAKQAKNGFEFPGVGTLVVVKRRARMGRAPTARGPIESRVRTELKFRISDAFQSQALRPRRGGGKRPTDAKPAYAVVRVWFATDRRATGETAPTKLFDGGRGELSFGVSEVSIPRDHRLGKLEGPSILRLDTRADPRRHVVVLTAQPLSWAECRAQLANRVAEHGRRQILVFIHGFNVSFTDALRRTAQLAYDLAFDGAAVAYSWPSQAQFRKYPVDETNIEWTAPHLTECLRSLQTDCSAKTIHFIAHSMGNRALSRMLSGPAIADGAAPNAASISQVILTAPDIDAEVFKQLAQAMVSRAARVTLYASSNDKALAASRRFHGYARAGEAGKGITVVNGVDTVDVSALNTDLIGHSYFGDRDSVLGDIYYVVREGLAPSARYGLKQQTKNGLAYWEFKPKR